MSASTVDTITLERMGVPASVIGTKLLVNTTGKAAARLQGVPDLPFVILEEGKGNPIFDMSPEELRERVLFAVERVTQVLTGQPIP